MMAAAQATAPPGKPVVVRVSRCLLPGPAVSSLVALSTKPSHVEWLGIIPVVHLDLAASTVLARLGYQPATPLVNAGIRSSIVARPLLLRKRLPASVFPALTVHAITAVRVTSLPWTTTDEAWLSRSSDHRNPPSWFRENKHFGVCSARPLSLRVVGESQWRRWFHGDCVM